MDKNVLILIGVFVLALVSLLFLYKKMKEGFGPTNLKIYGITLIIFAALLLSLSDIPSEKTAACYGILGAIAGYLFGLKSNE